MYCTLPYYCHTVTYILVTSRDITDLSALVECLHIGSDRIKFRSIKQRLRGDGAIFRKIGSAGTLRVRFAFVCFLPKCVLQAELEVYVLDGLHRILETIVFATQRAVTEIELEHLPVQASH